MKKIIKPIALVLLAAFIIIQFFRPEKNLSSSETIAANDISKLYPVPQEVGSILQTSCYDCHSNNTHYPWYSNFQPVAWWLADHVNEGKNELNFSEFASYRIGKQYRKLEKLNSKVFYSDDNLYELSTLNLLQQHAIDNPNNYYLYS
jgi:hypothetical protein